MKKGIGLTYCIKEIDLVNISFFLGSLGKIAYSTPLVYKITNQEFKNLPFNPIQHNYNVKYSIVFFLILNMNGPKIHNNSSLLFYIFFELLAG